MNKLLMVSVDCGESVCNSSPYAWCRFVSRSLPYHESRQPFCSLFNDELDFTQVNSGSVSYPEFKRSKLCLGAQNNEGIKSYTDKCDRILKWASDHRFDPQTHIVFSMYGAADILYMLDRDDLDTEQCMTLLQKAFDALSYMDWHADIACEVKDLARSLYPEKKE